MQNDQIHKDKNVKTVLNRYLCCVGNIQKNELDFNAIFLYLCMVF